MRVEYRKKGANNWMTVAFFTKMPGEFTITPTTPNEPESGEIRARFIKKSEDYGEFSPNYVITVS